MSTVVLVGGNGYIGREVTRQWLQRDPEAQLHVTSRSGSGEIQDARVHHIQVDPGDAAAFAEALPDAADYIVNFTYGNRDAIVNIRDYAETHGADAIGNIGVAVAAPGYEDFSAKKDADLAFLRESDVRVANYDATAVYGAGRDDQVADLVRSGAFDEQPPVHVEVVARVLIDRLVRDWRR